MKKWKSLDKTGLKLSLILGLNWLIKILLKGQLFLFSSFFLCLFLYYIPSSVQLVIMNNLWIIVMFKTFVDIIIMLFTTDTKRMKNTLLNIVMCLSFTIVYYYINQHDLIELMVNPIFGYWLISVVVAFLVIFLQPILFKNYLFKHVINKAYLGIRKFTDELPPECNLYTDADEEDVEKRMKMINQHVIKEPYQGFVELSFLNRKMITSISYKEVQFEKKKERTFRDLDTIYYPVFRFYPFGKKEKFYHTLIQIKLSRRAAFRKID